MQGFERHAESPGAIMLRMWRFASAFLAASGVIFISSVAKADAIADANTAITNCDPIGYYQASQQFRQSLPAGADAYSRGFPRYPDPCGGSTVKVVVSGGVVNSSAKDVTKNTISGDVTDPHSENAVHPSLLGGVGGVGVEIDFVDLFTLLVTGQTAQQIADYAPEVEKAYAANFPIQVKPKPQSPVVRWGFDAHAYFFAGGDAHINGIPGGPFGTATGSDSFKISNNVLFTAGPWVSAPLMAGWTIALTGGFAELNQTLKYTCASFCAVAPATPAFTASKDTWVAGGYIGTRVTTPISIPGLPASTIGIDYKHIFLDSYTVSLGSPATRQVTSRLSPDLDIVTVRFAVSIR
jgi:hypothetical protein